MEIINSTVLKIYENIVLMPSVWDGSLLCLFDVTVTGVHYLHKLLKDGFSFKWICNNITIRNNQQLKVLRNW